MDVGFMENYFKLRYEDFMQENIFIGAEYHDMRRKSYDRICELENRLHPVSEELVELMNRTLDDLADKEGYLIERAYLQGAFDRERMLR